MENFRNSNSSNDLWNIYPSNHGFSNAQNYHTKDTSNVQTTVFHQHFNSSKFNANDRSQDISHFQNTSSSSRNSTVRIPSDTFAGESTKPIHDLPFSCLLPRPQINNLQLNQRFPFPCIQPQYMKNNLPSPVQNLNVPSKALASTYHPHNGSFQNMNNYPPVSSPISSISTSNVDQPMQNKIPSQCPLSSQNTSWSINFPHHLPPPPIQSQLPMTVSSALISENNSTNVNNIVKQFLPNVPPRQNEQFPNNLLPTYPPITKDKLSLPPFVSPMIPIACTQSSYPMSVLASNFSAQSEKERQLLNFLNKFHPKEKDLLINKNNLTVVEFRSALKIGFSLLKRLSETKSSLMELLNSDEDQWSSCAKNALQLQHQLSDVCNMLCNPDNVRHIQNRLLKVKKKREYKKRRKLTMLSMKQEKEKYREGLNQEIDKWLDNIKEKNLDIKRKMEMKKEADIILSEVRKKIHEAKRTVEKLKIFEKLRNARQANAMKKSLFIHSEHNKKFEEKVLILKNVMLKQLTDYEAEERALKVMLETEQEEQLEQEALWRIRKMKTILQRKQKNIKESLFGDTDEPSPSDPIYLFYSHHSSANNNISSLVQIRHQWDVYLANDGESIPQQWVVPVPPSSTIWEKFCSS